MKIDTNIIIKCNNLEEVKDCFEKLNELVAGFKPNYNNKNCVIVFYSSLEEAFLNGREFIVSKDSNFVNYSSFLKLYNKQIKKLKETKLVVDKNGKILKVNDFKDEAIVYYSNLEILAIVEEGISYEKLKYELYNRDYYISKEACEKAEKRNIIRRKLEALAFELNRNRDITEEEWKDKDLKKYCLANLFDSDENQLWYGRTDKTQGTIFCLSRNFVDKAIELIGEEDLKDYLINC